MTEQILNDFSNVTVKIEEYVAIKTEVVDSDSIEIPLSDFVPYEGGNVSEFYKSETQFITPGLNQSNRIKSEPSGSSNNIIDNSITSDSSHRHVKTHGCSECDRSFSYKSELNRHINSVHLKLMKFVCNECYRAFSQQGHLKVHVDAVHRKWKRFACAQCDRAFNHKGHLKTHQDAVHRELKKYKCGECARSLSSKQSLKVHVDAIHSKLKNYVCAECNRSFGSRSNLIAHVQKTHPILLS